MTGLLVSVRSAAEAQVALAGGADIIDVKEPSRGALGAADPRVWREVHTAVSGRATTSVVLGELSDETVNQLAPQAVGFEFAKIGLAGCGSDDAWLRRWNRVFQSLPDGVQLVPVAYADWQRAHAPSPSRILATATGPSRLIVLDTFDKSGGSLLDVLEWSELERLFNEAQAASVRLVLAGRLDEPAIERLLPLPPAFIGVRGAVCPGGRTGSIDAARVARLAGLVRRKCPPALPMGR